MLKCEVGKEIGCYVECKGTLADAVNDVLNLIGDVHHLLLKDNILEAAMFRTALTEAVQGDALWASVDKEVVE